MVARRIDWLKVWRLDSTRLDSFCQAKYFFFEKEKPFPPIGEGDFYFSSPFLSFLTLSSSRSESFQNLLPPQWGIIKEGEA